MSGGARSSFSAAKSRRASEISEVAASGQAFHDVDGKHYRGLVPDLNFVHSAGGTEILKFNLMVSADC